MTILNRWSKITLGVGKRGSDSRRTLFLLNDAAGSSALPSGWNYSKHHPRRWRDKRINSHATQ